MVPLQNRSVLLLLSRGQLVTHLHLRGYRGKNIGCEDITWGGDRFMPRLQEVYVVHLLALLSARLAGYTSF